MKKRKQILVVLLSSLVLSGCNSHVQPLEPETATEIETTTLDQGHAIEAEFRKIADRLRDSENRYYGQGTLQRLLQIDEAKMRGLELVRHQLALSWHHLRTGNVEEAVRLVDQAFKSRQLPDFPLPSALKNRALVYLRLAEVKNCIEKNNCDCCIFPLTGGGVHLDQSPAREAKKALLEYLEIDPGDFGVVWILNLVSMALGEHPEGIPDIYQISKAAFESKEDMGRFKDVAKSLGINTFNLCGGVIVEDFSGDGKLDIVTSTYDLAGPLSYYRNAGDGSFDDVSLESGLSHQFGGLNCIGADYDNDGDTDILVLRGAWLSEDGEIRNSLLQNDGSGKFTDVSFEAGIADPACPTQSGVWGDFNGDGFLDIYIVNESRKELNTDGIDYPSQLFINQRDGTFKNLAEEFGVTNNRFGKGVTTGDYDNDGDLDIYVSNIGSNRLYQNLNNKGFEDVAPELGVTFPEVRSFATWFFDFNNDGWLDLFVTAYDATTQDLALHYLGDNHQATTPKLYRNIGDGTFAEVGDEVGLDFPCLPMGANFGDLDYDGFLDLYLTTGDPDYQTLMPNIMLRNSGGQNFLDVTTAGGFGHLQKGHGVAFADIDDDGDQDIYHQLGGFFPGDKFHNVLFENPGHGNKYLVLDLVGIKCNRDAIGARVEVTIVEGGKERSVHRAVGSVSSFGGSPCRLEIGLGKAEKIVSITIAWPGDVQAQSYSGLGFNSYYRLEQGKNPTKLDIKPSKFLSD